MSLIAHFGHHRNYNLYINKEYEYGRGYGTWRIIFHFRSICIEVTSLSDVVSRFHSPVSLHFIGNPDGDAQKRAMNFEKVGAATLMERNSEM